MEFEMSFKLFGTRIIMSHLTESTNGIPGLSGDFYIFSIWVLLFQRLFNAVNVRSLVIIINNSVKNLGFKRLLFNMLKPQPRPSEFFHLVIDVPSWRASVGEFLIHGWYRNSYRIRLLIKNLASGVEYRNINWWKKVNRYPPLTGWSINKLHVINDTI